MVRPRRVPPRAAQARYAYGCLYPDCWLAQFDTRPCEGRMDLAHLITKQVLRRARAPIDLWDERLWVHACRFHHGQFDNYRLTVPRESLPPAFLEACREVGLDWWVDRRYREGATA